MPSTQRALSNKSCGMLSGTLRISCITFPAFCRRSSSFFVSPGFFANVQAPSKSRPATIANEFFAYFIGAPPHHLFFFACRLNFCERASPRKVRVAQRQRGNFSARRALNPRTRLDFNWIQECLG